VRAFDPVPYSSVSSFDSGLEAVENSNLAVTNRFDLAKVRYNYVRT
jgi:hypothetical protein